MQRQCSANAPDAGSAVDFSLLGFPVIAREAIWEGAAEPESLGVRPNPPRGAIIGRIFAGR